MPRQLVGLGGAGYCFLVEADGDPRGGVSPHLLHTHHRSLAKNTLVTGKVWRGEDYAYSRAYGRLKVRVKEDAAFTQVANHANVRSGHGRALHFSSSMHEGSRAGTRNNVASAGKNHSNGLAAFGRPPHKSLIMRAPSGRLGICCTENHANYSGINTGLRGRYS